MTYTIENAKKILREYNRLIVNNLVSIESITDICIVPSDPTQMSDFLEHYQTETASNSLKLAGFDENEVRIVVVREQTLTSPSFMLDLDIYLTQKKIEKIYDSAGCIKEEN